MNLKKSLLCTHLLFTALLLPAMGLAQETTAPEAPPIEPEAMAILQDAAAHLAGAPSFSVSILAGYDVVQTSGQKIEFNELRKVVVQRPGKLRVEVEESNGDLSQVIFDGKELITFDRTHNVYAKASIDGGIDAAVTHFVGELRMRLPLAILLLTTFPAEIERRVQAIEYVEETSILGEPSDHLAASTAEVDFQVWVTKGDKPLIQRVIITYKTEPGSPQFRALFADWNFAPAASDKQFSFTPPADATRIQFLAHMVQSANSGSAAPIQTGDKP